MTRADTGSGAGPDAETGAESGAGRAAMRLDKWLWHARFYRTRALAAQAVAGGKVRVNGRRVSKPATAVAGGAVLTFVVGGRARVIRVAGFDDRRGPATQARNLYEDLAPQASGPGETPQTPLD